MKTKKQNKWRLLFILITIVVIGWACDDEATTIEEKQEELPVEKEEEKEGTDNNENSENPPSPNPEPSTYARGNHTYIPKRGQLIMQLNVEDHRFEDLKTIGRLYDIGYPKDMDDYFEASIWANARSFNDTLGITLRNDSLFLLHNDSVFYPIKMPDDFLKHFYTACRYTMSGIVKEKPDDDAGYHPLILEKLWMFYNINH